MIIPFASKMRTSVYYRLFRNRAFTLVWSGQTISFIGDAFFALAVMWVVYAQSGSALLTAGIQIVWQLSSALVNPLAGVFVDRWDRKRTMVVTNLLAAAVVGGLAALIPAHGRFSPLLVFAAIFLLNSLSAFMNPARYAILPETVGNELLTTAAGLFTSADHVAYLIASALVGVVLLVLGTRGAVWADAFSFAVVALCIAIAPLPKRARRSTLVLAEHPAQRTSFLGDMGAGWRIMRKHPVIKAMLWLSLLINVASFIGPLYPALISQRLHGGAVDYGIITTAGVIGGILGGVLAGSLERRLGAGRLMVMGWSLAGLTLIGMAISTSLPLTTALEVLGTFGLIAGGVPISSLMLVLVPEEYRGRVQGITSSLVVLAIPLSAALGGWLADLFGAAPLFAIGGCWVIGVAALAWGNRHIRAARVER